MMKWIGAEFKGKPLIGLNRIWLIAHNGVPFMAQFSLTSPHSDVHQRERSLALFYF